MKYTNPDIDSSYRANDLGQTLYDLVLDLKPKTIIEFGALNGYSTVAMAMALDELGRGKITSYDLWKKYPYKHALMSDAEENVRVYGLDKYVEFYSQDFWTWNPEKFDLLHLDLSNDGDILREAAKKLKGYGGHVAFEGGSRERDEVEWMIKYDKLPISLSGVKYHILDPLFPSLSILT